ncbi:unnamed protein product [Anisakis simplex]|uniref:Uncharacterized protein n=1 Tax=Anisakis simplex TaxID=6269 RepID=A0A3P6NMD9_ANISI|nr:unnamed protein product [Anisakis simplex]
MKSDHIKRTDISNLNCFVFYPPVGSALLTDTLPDPFYSSTRNHISDNLINAIISNQLTVIPQLQPHIFPYNHQPIQLFYKIDNIGNYSHSYYYCNQVDPLNAQPSVFNQQHSAADFLLSAPASQLVFLASAPTVQLSVPLSVPPLSLPLSLTQLTQHKPANILKNSPKTQSAIPAVKNITNNNNNSNCSNPKSGVSNKTSVLGTKRKASSLSSAVETIVGFPPAAAVSSAENAEATTRTPLSSAVPVSTSVPTNPPTQSAISSSNSQTTTSTSTSCSVALTSSSQTLLAKPANQSQPSIAEQHRTTQTIAAATVAATKDHPDESSDRISGAPPDKKHCLSAPSPKLTSAAAAALSSSQNQTDRATLIGDSQSIKSSNSNNNNSNNSQQSSVPTATTSSAAAATATKTIETSGQQQKVQSGTNPLKCISGVAGGTNLAQSSASRKGSLSGGLSGGSTALINPILSVNASCPSSSTSATSQQQCSLATVAAASCLLGGGGGAAANTCMAVSPIRPPLLIASTPHQTATVNNNSAAAAATAAAALNSTVTNYHQALHSLQNPTAAAAAAANLAVAASYQAAAVAAAAATANAAASLRCPAPPPPTHQLAFTVPASASASAAVAAAANFGANPLTSCPVPSTPPYYQTTAPNLSFARPHLSLNAATNRQAFATVPQLSPAAALAAVSKAASLIGCSADPRATNYGSSALTIGQAYSNSNNNTSAATLTGTFNNNNNNSNSNNNSNTSSNTVMEPHQVRGIVGQQHQQTSSSIPSATPNQACDDHAKQVCTLSFELID